MRRKSGFTPTEIVISMISASILVWGLASALKLVTISYDRPASTSWQTLEAARLLESMMADVSQATSFLERTPHSIRFTIPDRNEDGTPQTIRYSWSGVEGDPLLYQFNGGDPIELAGVEKFTLEYITRQFEVGSTTNDAPEEQQSVVFHGPPTEAMATSLVTLLSIDKPSGTKSGDLLIAAVSVDSVVSGLALDLGWTPISINGYTPTPLLSSAGVTFGLWYKIAGPLEPSSYTFTWLSINKQAYGWMMRFTGHDPSKPIHAAHQASSDAPLSPGITTTIDNTMIVRLGGFKRHRIVVGEPGLPGHTPINMNRSSNTFSAASGGSGYVMQEAAGPSGTSNFSLTGSEPFITVTIAIAPEPGD